MKAHFEDIASKKGSDSFVAYAFTVDAFEFKWHYHPEYELTLISEGSGKRIVGDRCENFRTGDLVLLGPGLPHTWSSEIIDQHHVSAIVVQFSKAFMNNFIQLSEFTEVSGLLSRASCGLYFPAPNRIYPLLKELPALTGIKKISSLFEILQQLTHLESESLSSSYFKTVKGEKTENRINKVCQYVISNSAETITLGQAADLVHLSRSAFSKFFKRATGKTFSEYVNEIRIGNACQLLVESDKTIGAIAYESGFDSLTYFNRIFMRLKNTTPGNFRKNRKPSHLIV